MGLTRPKAAQINTVVTNISDPILVLSQNSTAANIDVGFIVNRDSGPSANVAFVWQEATDQFIMAYTASTGLTNANISVSSYADLKVNQLISSSISMTGSATFGQISSPLIGNIGAVHYGTTANIAGITTTGTLNSPFIGNTGATLFGTTANIFGIATLGQVSSPLIGNTGAVLFGTTGNLTTVNATTLNTTGTAFIGAVNSTQIGNTGATLTGTTASIIGTATIGNVQAVQFGNITAVHTGSTLLLAGVATVGGVNSPAIGNAGTILSSQTLTTTGTGTIGNVQAVQVGNVNTLLTGAIQTPAQTNITSVGTLTGLAVSGVATIGQISSPLFGNLGAVHWGSTANITGTATIGAVRSSDIGNTGAVFTGATLSATGTATIGNIQTVTVGNVSTTLFGLLQSPQTSLAVTGLTTVGNLQSNWIGNVTSTLTAQTINAVGTATIGAVRSSDIGNAAAVFTGATDNISGTSTIGNVQAARMGNINTTLVAGTTTINGITTFNDPTNVTSVTSAALVIAGGVAVNKDLWVQGNIYAANLISTGYFSANVSSPLVYLETANVYPYNYDIGFYSHFVGGPANIYAHTGLVRDDADSVWKLFSNVAEPSAGQFTYNTNTIYDPLRVGLIYSGQSQPISYSNALGVFTGNANAYSQVSAQNLSSGAQASTDFIATADTGTDSANYIDMGINGSGWNYNIWTVSGAKDGYLYVNGGALTLGTDTAAKNISFHTGGTLSTNIRGTFTDAGLTVNTATASSSITTGALVVNGGAGIAGDLYVGTQLWITQRAGDEGGQLNLAPAVTNTTLVGNIVIDVYQNKLRIFESAGTNRGGFFDLSSLSSTVGTNLGGAASVGGADTMIQFNNSNAFTGAVSFHYFNGNGVILANAGVASSGAGTGTMQITGGIGVSGNVWADQVYASNNGNGTNFRIGDDMWLGDVNSSNTTRLMGVQDTTAAYLRFGSSDTNALGRTGAGALVWSGTFASGALSAPTIGNSGAVLTGASVTTGTGTFGLVNAVTIGNASATLTGGTLNITGVGTIGSVQAMQFGNTSASYSGSTLTLAGIATVGGVNSPIIGNASATLTGGTLNITGLATIGSINSPSIGNASAALTGTIQTASQTNITAIGTLSTLAVTGTATIGSINSPSIGNASAALTGTIQTASQTNITAVGNLTSLSVAGTTTAWSTIAAGAANVISIGSSTNWFSTVYGSIFNGKAITAQYADLAENYASDSDYAPGTVVVFGGDAEVTISVASHDPRIAGVISTNPAYHMNHGAEGLPVALQGRVPCQVLGPVAKGDRVVSSDIPGVAQRLDKTLYEPGCIIGKALESIDVAEIRTIEVVVGRV